MCAVWGTVPACVCVCPKREPVRVCGLKASGLEVSGPQLAFTTFLLGGPLVSAHVVWEGEAHSVGSLHLYSVGLVGSTPWLESSLRG